MAIGITTHRILTEIRNPQHFRGFSAPAKEADGYDREAYEHKIGRSKTSRTYGGTRARPSVGQASSKSTYILKLEGPLDTAVKIQEAVDLDAVPAIATGTGDLGEASFVIINSTARDAIFVWLSKQRIDFAPTFVWSQHFQQYRADGVDAKFMPTQNQHPVWYFFYGNLAVPDILTRRLALVEEPIFMPATVTGGLIKKWRGKYNSLIDGPDTACSTDGHILSSQRSMRSRCGSTRLKMTRFVRCAIIKDTSDTVKGLAFKFVGPSEHLT